MKATAAELLGMKSYYRRNQRRLRKAKALYYARNKKKILRAASAYYHQHSEAILARRQGHNLKHRASFRGRAIYLVAQAEKRAREKGRSFDLTIEWVEQRLKKGCALSGLPFDLITGQGKGRVARAPSIDRIDSAKGYTKRNCRMIFLCLNLALSRWGVEAVLPVWRAVLRRNK